MSTSHHGWNDTSLHTDRRGNMKHQNKWILMHKTGNRRKSHVLWECNFGNNCPMRWLGRKYAEGQEWFFGIAQAYVKWQKWNLWALLPVILCSVCWRRVSASVWVCVLYDGWTEFVRWLSFPVASRECGSLRMWRCTREWDSVCTYLYTQFGVICSWSAHLYIQWSVPRVQIRRRGNPVGSLLCLLDCASLQGSRTEVEVRMICNVVWGGFRQHCYVCRRATEILNCWLWFYTGRTDPNSKPIIRVSMEFIWVHIGLCLRFRRWYTLSSAVISSWSLLT
jgi:hypothetical protein